MALAGDTERIDLKVSTSSGCRSSISRSDGSIARRGGAALVFLKGAAPTADDPPSLFLCQSKLLAHRFDPRGIGGPQFLVGIIQCLQIGTRMDGVTVVIGIPAGNLDRARQRADTDGLLPG